MKKLTASLIALVLFAPACGGEREQVPGPAAPPAPTTTEPAAASPGATSAPPAAATTPEPAPRPPLSQLQKAAMQALLAAFNAHDSKKIASLYAPDARVGGPGPAGWMEETGPAAVEDGHARLFAAFPDLKWASPRVYMSGPVVIQEWVATGTHQGDLGATKPSQTHDGAASGPKPRAPSEPTSRTVGLNGASVYWFNEDGQITRDHTYYDAATMGAQVGAQKGKARPVPTLPTGETAFITATGGLEDTKWVNATKGLYTAFGGKDDKAFLSSYSNDVVNVDYSQPEDRRGVKAAEGDYQTLRKAFPDARVTPQNVWGFGDHVIAEVTMTGTQTGQFGAVKPSKKPVTTHSLEVLKFNAEGKVLETATYASSGELLSQIGVAQPAPGGQPGPKAPPGPVLPSIGGRPAHGGQLGVRPQPGTSPQPPPGGKPVSAPDPKK